MAFVRARARRAGGLLSDIFLTLTLMYAVHVAFGPVFTSPALPKPMSIGSVLEPAKLAASVAGPQMLATMEEADRSRVAHRDVSRSVGAESIDPQPQSVLARSNMLMTGVLGAVSLALGKKKQSLLGRAAGDSESAGDSAEDSMSESQKFRRQITSGFCDCFAIWLTIIAIVSLKSPGILNWISSDFYGKLLGLVIFSAGITLTIDDFVQCLKKPGTIALNFIACYAIMPVIAYALAMAIGAEGGILAGLVLVGSVNGGQASNLCALIANGDVALSVLMTTSTTIGCTFMTPLICKAVLGTIVPIDTWGIVMSTLKVVILPIVVGVVLNTLAPKTCKRVSGYTPVAGVFATVVLVGASVSKCAEPILNAGLPLQFACMALHTAGGVIGYMATKVFNYDEKTCRTCAIETSMKSSAFGFLIASLHFGNPTARVPSAVSYVWMAMVGSLMAVFWKGKPVTA